MIKNQVIFLILMLGLNFSLILSGCTNSEPTQDRDEYTNLELNEIEGDLTGDEPEAITLELFGVKEPVEGNFQEEIAVKDGEAFQKTVILTQTGFADDSVRGFRYRLEYEFDQSIGEWRLVWAGRQQSCYRADDPQAWTTEYCP